SSREEYGADGGTTRAWRTDRAGGPRTTVQALYSSVTGLTARRPRHARLSGLEPLGLLGAPGLLFVALAAAGVQPQRLHPLARRVGADRHHAEGGGPRAHQQRMRDVAARRGGDGERTEGVGREDRHQADPRPAAAS